VYTETLAYVPGSLLVIMIIVGLALAAYSIWYIFFKLGK
jgi:hypothetical protein